MGAESKVVARIHGEGRPRLVTVDYFSDYVYRERVTALVRELVRGRA